MYVLLYVSGLEVEIVWSLAITFFCASFLNHTRAISYLDLILNSVLWISSISAHQLRQFFLNSIF